MNTNEFGKLIAKLKVPRSFEAFDVTSVKASLRASLVKLPNWQLKSFHHHYARCTIKARFYPLADAVWLIHGYLSDDTFSDFSCTLPLRGKRIFESVTAGPDTIIRFLPKGVDDLFYAEGYFFDIADDIFLERQGEQSTEGLPMPNGYYGDERWRGKSIDLENLDAIARRFPRISKWLRENR